jgi:hypothetical protein
MNRNIDPAIRERVMELVPRFLDALDAATNDSSPRAVDELRQAADDVMRATASVMIEVGRHKPFGTVARLVGP